MEKYEVTGIPSLVVVSKDGRVITLHGRSEVTEKGPKAFQLWLQNAKPRSKSTISRASLRGSS